MEHATQVQLIRAALDQFERNSFDMRGEESFTTLDRYLDPKRCQREVDVLFRQLPLVVGAASLVGKPGDCLTHDLSGVPILVLRGRDGVLRAFLNVCRHRGTRLVAAGQTECKGAIVCPYHAWTFAHDGKLVGLPHAEGFPTLDKAENGLVALPVHEAYGLVFVIPTPQEKRFDFEAWFGEAGADLRRFGMDSTVRYFPRRFTRKMNWKLMFDANLEAYHFRFAHSKTIAHMFGDNKGVFDVLDPHMRIFLPRPQAVDLRGKDESDWNIRTAGNVIYALFPNTIMLVEPDHTMVMTVWPDGPETVVLDSIALIPEEPQTDKARDYWDRNMKIFWDALDEDYDMMESMQSTMRSGANQHLRFGRYEWLSTRFHEIVEREIA
jgi:phenylpropionate dioxygenase-like ring-hydroxylating dioxygenase large terminal subunit